MKYYNKLCEAICRGIMAICAALALVLLISSFLQVFSRYVIGSAITWTDECARYCYIWLDILGAAVLVYRGGHAVVDLLSKKLKGPARKVYDTFCFIVLGYMGVIFAVFGYRLCQVTISQTSPALKLPMGLVYGVLPISGILIGFFTVNRVLNLWIQADNKEERA